MSVGPLEILLLVGGSIVTVIFVRWIVRRGR
jgi:hypothetical protein